MVGVGFNRGNYGGFCVSATDVHEDVGHDEDVGSATNYFVDCNTGTGQTTELHGRFGGIGIRRQKEKQVFANIVVHYGRCHGRCMYECIGVQHCDTKNAWK